MINQIHIDYLTSSNVMKYEKPCGTYNQQFDVGDSEETKNFCDSPSCHDRILYIIMDCDILTLGIDHFQPYNVDNLEKSVKERIIGT